MKAIVITEPGAPEVLQVREREKPRIAEREVLVAVKAAGVNRPDVFQRKGNYAAPPGVPADIPGLEVSGIIQEIGSGVKRWKQGDKVCCLVAGGGYAEFVSVHEEICLPIPEGLSFAEAASLPETIFTVWDNVFRRGALQGGEGILIHGGAGGIGSTAIQLAKAFGAHVFATVSSAEKAAYCRELGADDVIDYTVTDFAEALKDREIHVVLDSIGGSYFKKHIDLLQSDGRIIQINAMQGAKVELNLLKMMQKRIILTGSTLRARDIAFKSQLADEVLKNVWPMLGENFHPQIYAELSLSEASKAHELMERGEIFGKIVLLI